MECKEGSNQSGIPPLLVCKWLRVHVLPNYQVLPESNQCSSAEMTNQYGSSKYKCSLVMKAEIAFGANISCMLRI